MMTGIERDFLTEAGLLLSKAPSQKFTITGADDWPMLVWASGISIGAIVILLGTIVSLLVFGFKRLEKRIGEQRIEDAGKCHNCNKNIWDYIKGPMLNAIMECCYIGDAEKIKLMADIRSKTEGA